MLVSIPADLQRFRRLTLGRIVVLGRRTLATFPGGRPLEGRTNLILSRSVQTVEGAQVFPDLAALFARLRNCDLSQVSVIGGAAVYEALLPYCEKAYVTKTFLAPEADAFFPDLDRLANWSVEAAGPVLEENGVPFQYYDYVNSAPTALPL